MIDFSWTECTRSLSLFFCGIYILFLAFYYKKYVSRFACQKKKADSGLILFAFILILVVAASSQSDWFSYQRLVWDYDFTPGTYHHVEPVYDVIIRLVNRNYMLFRIVVWGGAFLLTYLIFKRFNDNPNVSCFFMIAAFLLIFNYARATLGIACYFFGLSFLINPSKEWKSLNYLLVPLFLFSAYSFHHSLLVIIVLTIAAYLPLNKPYMIVLMLISLPLVAYMIKESFVLVDLFEVESLSNKLELYSNAERSKANIFGKLRLFIEYGAFYIPIILDTLIISKHRHVINVSIIRLQRIMLATSIFSLAFLFMGLENRIMFYRFLYMTFIPITIITTHLLEKQMMNLKQYAFIIIWGIASQLYSLLYAIYIA